MKHRPSAGIFWAALLGAGLQVLPCTDNVPQSPKVSTSPQTWQIPQVFGEPLFLLSDPLASVDPEDSQALSQTLKEFVDGHDTKNVAPILRFLETHPASPWRASLLANLANVYRRHGYLGKAMDAASQSWELCRTSTHPNAGPVGDQAAGELLDLYTRVGNRERLEALFSQLQGRHLRGSAAQKAISARRMFWKMVNQPETSFQCGPMALSSLAHYRGPEPLEPRRPQEARSIEKGTSLAQNLDWGNRWHLGLQAAKREPGTEILVPAVVHWKTGHYSALVQAQDGHYRVLDPTYGEDLWISPKALDQEATGYALVRWGPLPKGWRAVEKQEAETIWGKGDVGLGPNDGPFPGDDIRPLHVSSGRAEYGIYTGYSSLTVKDTVLGYQPPRGLPVRLELRYHQRFAYQPQTFTHAHTGPNWTFNWVSYIEDDPTQPLAAVGLYTSEGGRHTFSGFDMATGAFEPQLRTRERLLRIGPATYERRFADGSMEVFNHSNGAVSPRRIFITKRSDPSGNALTFAYDPQGRLTSLTDAIGQITKLEYGDTKDSLRLTGVTDPFGRSARLEYNADGQQAKVTDAAGLSYTYEYGPDVKSPDAPADFLRAMKTPYGTYSFSTKEDGMVRWLEMQDPTGGKERVEFHNDIKEMKQYDEVLPPPGSNNQYLDLRNSYFWDRKTMALHPGDFNRAEILHYIHGATMSVLSSLLECEKKPLENRVWYRYPKALNNVSEGIGSHPSQVGRTLVTGVFDIRTAAFNDWGNPTRTTDAKGRTLHYQYSPDGLDLLEVKENGPTGKILATATYNEHHQPLSATNAKGDITRFSYNAFGQPTAIKDPKGKGTIFGYDTKGFLLRIADASKKVDLTFTYDAAGRVHTLAQGRRKPITLEYDALDRLVLASYSDKTKETWAYDRYDLASTTDRQGHVSHIQYDSLRRPIRIEGQNSQAWNLGWSPVGGLLSVQEEGKKATTWERDLQDRVMAKILPDGTRIEYAYDAAGRASWKEPKGASLRTPRKRKGLQAMRDSSPALASWQPQDLIQYLQRSADPVLGDKAISENRPTDLPSALRTAPNPVGTYLHSKAHRQDLLPPWIWERPLVTTSWASSH